LKAVRVESYNLLWPQMFREESIRIKSILKDELTEIHHIGSTAIPGISAKPVIDMLPVVKNIMRVDDYNKPFIRHGYEPRSEYGLAGRRYFVKGNPESTHHVHIYQEGDPAIIRHTAFRDYMITHPSAAKAYSLLKENLAQQHADDRNAYIDGKASFVQEHERLALEWWKSY
jgi:GrpB-like predicted nucleotidyltransferase (UPF0157 family)